MAAYKGIPDTITGMGVTHNALCCRFGWLLDQDKQRVAGDVMVNNGCLDALLNQVEEDMIGNTMGDKRCQEGPKRLHPRACASEQ